MAEEEEDVGDADDAVVVDVFLAVRVAGGVGAGAIVPGRCIVVVLSVGVCAAASGSAGRDGAMLRGEEAAAVFVGCTVIVMAGAWVGAPPVFDGHAGAVGPSDVAAEVLGDACIVISVPIATTDLADFGGTVDHRPHVEVLLADAAFVAADDAFF